jgi:diacylglycerol kinase (ATP)
MPRIKLILNPASDRWHTKDRTKSLREVVEQQAASASGGPFELSWETTARPRHATEIARQASEEGYDIVVAVGGDGTVHEVVNGLMQVPAAKRPRLGILPVGSGNDFAHNLNVPASPEDAVHCLFGGLGRRIDIGTITDGTGRTEYWNNTVGAGFSGAVNIATRKITHLRGFLVYLTAVLQTILFKPQALATSVCIGEDPAFQRDLCMISICNGPREGGGFPVAPGALMDDGQITYTLMRKVNRVQMLYFLPVVMAAKHMGYKKFFQGGETTRMRLETDRTMAIHADGEVFGPWESDVRSLEVSILPGAVDVLTCT